jgi:hypothetical protein
LPTPDHGRATVNVAGPEVLRLGAFFVWLSFVETALFFLAKLVEALRTCVAVETKTLPLVEAFHANFHPLGNLVEAAFLLGAELVVARKIRAAVEAFLFHASSHPLLNLPAAWIPVNGAGEADEDEDRGKGPKSDAKTKKRPEQTEQECDEGSDVRRFLERQMGGVRVVGAISIPRSPEPLVQSGS